MGYSKGSIPWNKGTKRSLEVKQKISQSQKGKKASMQTRKKLSEIHKGSIPWNKGIKMSKEEKKIKRRQSWLKWYSKNKEKVRLQQQKYNQSRICDPAKVLEWRINGLRRNGFPLKLNPYRYSWAIESWSKTIKQQFNNQCQCCSADAKISHHILHKSKYPALSLNINNGIALCKSCHAQVHGWNMSN